MISESLVISFIDNHGAGILCGSMNLVDFTNAHQWGKQQILLSDIYVVFREHRFHKSVIISSDYTGDMTGRFT
ncbi:Uncharacterised protein [Bifidobacterium breve]|nr:Uncharacterised protein [Bifidobacterium breve]